MNAPKHKLVTSETWRKSLVDGVPAQHLAIGFKYTTGVERVTDDEIRALLRGLTEEEREAMKASGGDPDSPDRVLPWTISTEQRDRDFDRIMVEGWDLRNYRKNPVVLFGHNYRDLPIGKSIRVWKDTTGAPRLRALGLFTPKEMGGGFGFSVYELAKNGFLPASSVGFRPGKFEKDAEDETGRGYVFIKGHELLEWSPVPVPSNPGALQEARGLGIDLEPYATELEKLLDGETAMLWLPKAEAERLRKEIRPAKSTVVASSVTEDAEQNTASAAKKQAEPKPAEPTDEELAMRVVSLFERRPGILEHLARSFQGNDRSKHNDPTTPAEPQGRDPYAGTPFAGDRGQSKGASGGGDEGGAVDVIMRTAVSLSVTIERDVALIDQQIKALGELRQEAIERLMKARDLIDEKLEALSEKDVPKTEPDGDPAAGGADVYEIDFSPAGTENAQPDTKGDEEVFEVDLDLLNAVAREAVGR